MGGVILFILSSCQKSETSPSPNSISGIPDCKAKVIDDRLVFETEKDFIQYSETVNKMSMQEKERFEKVNNFVSYDSKVEQILDEYEQLFEVPEEDFDINKVHALRAKYADYIVITDTSLDKTYKGLYGHVINSDGYVQIGNTIKRYKQYNIYTTSLDNIGLLQNENYTHPDVIAHKTIVLNPNRIKPNSVNQWQGIFRKKEDKCGRWHRTKFEIGFYFTGGTPAYGQTGNMLLSYGFHYELKNQKKGWTGIWYQQKRSSTHTGVYNANYAPYVNFSDYDYSKTVSRNYCNQNLSRPWNSDPLALLLWQDEVISAPLWAYIDGIVYMDVCGSKQIDY